MSEFQQSQDFHLALNESARLLRQNRPGEAIRKLEPLYEKAPDHPDLVINLSGAYILQRKWNRAVSVLNKAVKIYPDNAMLWTNMGAAQLGPLETAGPRQQEKAMKAYYHALRADSEAPNVHYHLGLIYKERGELMRASAMFQRAVEVNPADTDAQYWLDRLGHEIAEQVRTHEQEDSPTGGSDDGGIEAQRRDGKRRSPMSSDLSGMASGETLVSTNAWPAQTVARWRENPERLAWVVLLVSFSIFALLAIAVPLTINYVVRYVTVSQEACLESTLGTLLLYPSSTAEPMAITNTRDDIQEGSRIVAGDESTQGTLGLVGVDGTDEILGSVQIYPGTVLDVLRIRRPMFNRSLEPYQARLHLEQGQARALPKSGGQRALSVQLDTPHGTVTLAAGSYQVSVNEEQTDITVRSGMAVLTNRQDASISLDAGLRAWMTADEFAHDPVPAERNLLVNGDFTEPMLNTWQSYVIAENVIPGSVRIIEREGRRVAHFTRQGEEDVPTEVGITQVVEKDVNVFDSLTFQLDVKLLHQSLSGAGYLSSEFPLRLEITYTDIYGKVLTWGYGFYSRDPENKNWRIISGEKIPPYNWYTYQSPNLMELLADTRPARINSVRIYASGWNYQSMVSEAYLLAQ